MGAWVTIPRVGVSERSCLQSCPGIGWGGGKRHPPFLRECAAVDGEAGLAPALGPLPPKPLQAPTQAVTCSLSVKLGF